MSTPSFAFPQSLADKYRPRTIADFVKLGRDERHYFGSSLHLGDSLEKLCIKANARSVRA